MRRPLRGLAAVPLAAAMGMALQACGPSGGTRPDAPVLQVVTGIYPLAQAITQIGNGKAVAVNVVPPGRDPRSYELTQTDAATVRSAGLVVLAGPGLQPSLDAAATTARSRIDAGSGSQDPYYWLDPAAMRKAVPAIAQAMEKADPAAAGAFRDGAQAFEAALDSTDIDYQSTLSTCPRRTVFAADGAFATTLRHYDLNYVAVGAQPKPEPTAVQAAAETVRAAGATAVFSETWTPTATVQAVAAAAGVKVASLDTLMGPPPGGWPKQATYINLLEANLGALSGALGCAGASGT